MTSSRFSKTALGVTGVLGLGALVGASLLWGRDDAPPAPASATDVTPPQDARTAPQPSADARKDAPCHFSPGQRLAFSVDLESSATQRVPGSPTPISMDLTVHAVLQAQAVDANEHATVWVGRLASLAAMPEAAMDTQPMAAPFLFEVDAQCGLTRFARRDTAPRTAARNQQALVWEAQFRVVDAATPVQVQNGNGVAEGLLAPEGSGRLRRTLDRYQALWNEDDTDVLTRGSLVVELGGLWFARLETQERFSFGETKSDSRTSFVRLATDEVAFSADEQDVTKYAWENLLPRRRHELVSRPFTSYDKARQDKVRALTTEQAMDQFAERSKQRVGIQSTWPELSAYFEVHPEAIGPAIKRYQAGGLPVSSAGDFFLALGKARVPEARDALLGIKRDDAAPGLDQVRSMFALVVREDVGPALAEEFRADVTRQLGRRTEEGRFLAGESMLALSTMSGSRDDAQVTRTSRQALESVLQSEADPQTRKVALAAVGNMGEPSTLPLVATHASSPDADTRKAAAKALSRMPPADADAMEIDWLRREKDPFVRKALYSVIQRQQLDVGVGASPALVEQALIDLKTEQSVMTRRHIVRLVSQSQVARQPQVREALKAQALFERKHRTSLFNEFARVLTRDEIAEVLR